ncbi:hypothetical protein IGK19_001043 [Enterococcus sp. DIV0837a]|nr:hypothetical protein SMS_01944 [Enterococcus faecium EnGen0184]
MNVSYLGPESSFTYQEACQLFPIKEADFLFCRTP